MHAGIVCGPCELNGGWRNGWSRSSRRREGCCGGRSGSGDHLEKLSSVHTQKVGARVGFCTGKPDASASDHLNDVFIHRQHVSAPRDIFDKKFAHHLIAKRVAQTFDPGGARGLITV